MQNVVKLGSTEYHFEIRSKFTIIQGDSGIGKSTLLSMFRRNRVKLKSEYKFVQLTERTEDETWEGLLGSRVGKNTVFYMDEDFHGLYTEDFQKAMANSKLKFLIVARDLLAHVPYGIQDVYTVTRRHNSNVHDVVPLYEPQPLRDWRNYKELVTEDSKSGFYFFSSFFKSVRSAGGKSNVLKEWRKCLHTVFVVDGVGFGSEIKRITEAMVKNRHNALWVLDSFEAMVLHSEFLGGDIEPGLFEDNREVFYERALQARMQLEGQVYLKNKVCRCLVFDCCYKDKCRLLKRGIKSELILGAVHKELEVFGRRTAAERVQQVHALENPESEQAQQVQATALADTDCGV